jgi:Trypsin-like peptidase domain
MMRPCIGTLLLAPVVFLCAQARGAEDELTRERLAQIGKPATALVECTYPAGRAHGAAFCVHSTAASSSFVTNAHIVNAPFATKISLILDAGLKTQRVLPARIVRQDKEKDLALLRIEGVNNFPTLPLGGIDSLHETQEVVAFGFPFDALLGESPKEFPAVSATAGNITSLRYKDDVLSRIQVDAVLKPGDSGGPVMDRKGLVIGVAAKTNAGTRAAGISFLLPVNQLIDFLAVPEMELKLPTVTRADMHKDVVFEAKATALIPPAKSFQFVLLLGGEEGKERKVAITEQQGVYRGLAVPVPPLPVRVTVVYGNGSVTGSIADRRVGVVGQEGKGWNLSQIRVLRWKPSPQVILDDGKILDGRVHSMDERGMVVNLGKEVVELNLASAVEARFEAIPPPPFVTCSLLAMQDFKEVGRITRFMTFDSPGGPAIDKPNIPPHTGPGTVKAPSLEQDRATRAMPGAIDDVCVGGDGRYLILHFPQLHKLGVFDVNALKITGYIPVEDDNAQFAAGMTKLLVALPEQRLLQRWDLATLLREASVPYQGNHKIQHLAMGSASQGPLLLSASDGPAASELVFFDVGTLKPIPLEFVGQPSIDVDAKTPLRASANGKVFSASKVNLSPQQMQTMILDGGKVRVYRHGGTIGHATPGPDGRFLYTGRGLYTAEAKVVGKEDMQNPYLLPAVNGSYYLALMINLSPGASRDGKSGLTLHMPGSTQPLSWLEGVELPDKLNSWDREKFALDQRIFLIPDAKLLITIPLANDKLILHRLDVEKEVEKSNRDYLFIYSEPPERVRKGSRFRYQLAVKSRKGGLAYRVDFGPKGMVITPDGLVRWDVPADFKETETQVNLSLRDKIGQEVVQTFKLVIEP